MSCGINLLQPTHRQFTYCMPGNPIALARPRLGRGRIYDEQTHLKIVARRYLENQHNDLPKFIGPLHVSITFFMGMPQGWSVKKKAGMNGRLHKSRPDFSNLLKFAEDVGHAIWYDDDAIIACICGSKRYSLDPRTEITITELGKDL